MRELDEESMNTEDENLINAIIRACKKHLSYNYTIDRYDGSNNKKAIVVKIDQDPHDTQKKQAQIKSDIIGHINSLFNNIKIRRDVSPDTEDTDKIYIKGDPLAKIYDQLIKSGYLNDPNPSSASSSVTTLPKRSQSSSSSHVASSANDQQDRKRKSNADRSAKQVKKVPAEDKAEINFEADPLDILVQAFVDFRNKGNVIDPKSYNHNQGYRIIISIPQNDEKAIEKIEQKKIFIQQLNKVLEGVTSLAIQKQRSNYPGGRPVDEPDDEIWLLAKAITSIYAHLEKKIERRLVRQQQSVFHATSAAGVSKNVPAPISAVGLSSAKAAAAVGLFKAPPSAAAASSPAQPARPLSLASPYIRQLQERYEALKRNNEALEQENAALRSIKNEALQLQQQIDAEKKRAEQLAAEEETLKRALNI